MMAALAAGRNRLVPGYSGRSVAVGQASAVLGLPDCNAALLRRLRGGVVAVVAAGGVLLTGPGVAVAAPCLGGSAGNGQAHGLVFPIVSGNQSNLWSALPDGSLLKQITAADTGVRMQQAWAPDGTFIAYACGSPSHIFVMHPDGSAITQLTNGTAIDAYPTVSPDSKKVAFQTNRAGGVQIYTVKTDGSSLTDVSNNTAQDWEPAWGPDGRIAFSSYRSGGYDIWVMNGDGSGQTKVENIYDTDQWPTWSPDGTQIAFSHLGYEYAACSCYRYNIYQAPSTPTVPPPATEAQITVVTATPAVDEREPSYSADGTRIAVIDESDSQRPLYLVPVDGTKWTSNSTWARVASLGPTSGFTPGPVAWEPAMLPAMPRASDLFGAGANPAAPNLVQMGCGDPVNCATGNFTESYTDLSVSELGGPLQLGRAYNALAAPGSATGDFGRGWTSSFGAGLTFEGRLVTVHQGDGSTVTFSPNGDGTYATSGWVQATLTRSGGSYSYTLPDRTVYGFSGAGRLTSVTDANANLTSLAYDAAGRLATVTGPTGRTLTYVRNTDGTVASVSDSAGHSAQYGYTSGDLTHVTDVRGEITQFGYDGRHRLTTVTDPRGHVVTSNVYDASDRVTAQTDALNHTMTWDYATPGHTKITDAAGHVTDQAFDNNVPTSITRAAGTASASTTTITYDSRLNPVTVTDGRGKVWTYGYDAAGNRTNVTDPLNHTTTSTFNSHHQPTSIVSPAGHETDYAYDSHGDLTSVTRSLAGIPVSTSMTYDSLGLLTSLTDPRGKQWTYGYDSHGDRTSTTTPLGHQASATYDASGHQATITSARGNEPGATAADFTTQITRNDAGAPTDITDPLGHHTTFSYDADGNLTDQTDRDGRHTHLDYDNANRLTQTTRPDESTITQTYDEAGQLLTQTDGAGHTTSYSYDALERLDSVTDPLGRTTSYTHDDSGNQTSLTDPQDRSTTFGYDDANRLTSISYDSGSPDPVTFSYDADGKRSAMTDSTGTSDYSYDSLGRLTSHTSGAGQTVHYGYDLADELTSIDYPDALTPLDTDGPGGQTPVAEGTVTRGYDDDGNLTTVSDWLDNTTSFGYDPEGHLTTVTRPNGTSASYSYDANSELASLTDVGGQADYTRSAEGLITNGPVAGQPNQSFTYDPLAQLTGAGAATYQYGAADNLTQTLNAAGQTAQQTFDAAHQLEQTTVGTSTPTSFTYDAQGNRTSAIRLGDPSVALTWDQANQLASYDGPDARDPSQTVSDTFAYNADGLRQTKTVNGQLTNEVYDLTNDLPLMIEDGPTAYITGPTGLPIEQIKQDGTTRYYSTDQLGSTTTLTDQTGDTVASYTYDAYGNPTGTVSSTENPFRYAGQYTDPETGLQYLRARYYDPSTGQFLSRDPLEAQTRDPYGYAADNPLSFTDPTGMDFLDKVGKAISGGSASFLDSATGGLSTDLLSALTGADPNCVRANFGPIGGVAKAAGWILPFGRGAKAAEGVAGVIKGYTRHGLAQAIARDGGRGVSPSAILDAIRSPLSKSVQADGATIYTGKDAVVIVSKEGRVITTHATNSAGRRSQP
jgi:RHS repeat-associated protein